MSKVKIRKELGYGIAGGFLILGATYLMAISPQAAATDQTRVTIEQTRMTNEAMAARIPALKAELATVADQIDLLQGLSRQVPAQVDQPGLYSELEEVASKAGLNGLRSVTLETPVPVASVSMVDTSIQDQDEDGSAGGGGDPAPEVLASYRVTTQVQGTTEQALAFLAGLEEAPRLAVVGNSEITTNEEYTQLTVTATFFLQQVEVEAIIEQIENLVALEAPPEPDAEEDGDATVDGEATDKVEDIEAEASEDSEG